MDSNKLHLSDLLIKNFRGIGRLTIRNLGRVTLITGLNGVGKTTVLEAVRVFASRGHHDMFQELLHSREECMEALNEDQDRLLSPDYGTLFFGRNATPHKKASIGPASGQDCLSIETVGINDLPEPQQELFSKFHLEAGQALRVGYRNAAFVLPWLTEIPGQRGADPLTPIPRALRRTRLSAKDMPAPINCESLGPGLPDNPTLAGYWDKIALTPQEDLVLRAINLTGQKIDHVAVIGDSTQFRRFGRRITVKLRDHVQPVPLKSLGDGIRRLFATSLALAVSHDGFLIVDEVENGIHYSVQQNFWSMVLNAAKEYNVQVLATTHSFDCIRAFASAANKIEGQNCALIRLEGEHGDLRAIEYTEEELDIAGAQNIEVR